MDRSSQDSHDYKIESQIREAFGRVTYTQTCHIKLSGRLEKLNERLKMSQIIISALTTGSFLVTIVSNEKVSAIIGAVLSVILLIINTYMKNFNLVEQAKVHQKTSDLLWKIREEYVSLLVDFDVLSVQDVMNKRDELQERTSEIYSNSPKTDYKSYKAAQKALKTEEEQTFSEKEIDVMLPNSIRRTEIK